MPIHRAGFSAKTCKGSICTEMRAEYAKREGGVGSKAGSEILHLLTQVQVLTWMCLLDNRFGIPPELGGLADQEGLTSWNQMALHAIELETFIPMEDIVFRHPQKNRNDWFCVLCCIYKKSNTPQLRIAKNAKNHWYDNHRSSFGPLFIIQNRTGLPTLERKTKEEWEAFFKINNGLISREVMKRQHRVKSK